MPRPSEVHVVRAVARVDAGPSLEELRRRVAQLEAELQNMQAALTSRPRIEHAIGMIMMLMPCSEPVAAAVLKKVSQNTNRKVRDVADLITTAASIGRAVPADVASALEDMMPPEQERTGSLSEGASQS